MRVRVCVVLCGCGAAAAVASAMIEAFWASEIGAVACRVVLCSKANAKAGGVWEASGAVEIQEIWKHQAREALAMVPIRSLAYVSKQRLLSLSVVAPRFFEEFFFAACCARALCVCFLVDVISRNRPSLPHPFCLVSPLLCPSLRNQRGRAS